MFFIRPEAEARFVGAGATWLVNTVRTGGVLRRETAWPQLVGYGSRTHRRVERMTRFDDWVRSERLGGVKD